MYQAIYETLKNYLNLEVIYRIEKKKLLLYPLQWKMKLFNVLCDLLHWTTPALCLQTDSSSDCIDNQYCLFFIEILW